MEPTIKYPKTDAGRRAYIKDSLHYSEIKNEGFKVISHNRKEKDRTLILMNDITGILIIAILSPVVIVLALYGAFKWLKNHTFLQPMSTEAKQLQATRKYLHECKKYRYEKN